MLIVNMTHRQSTGNATQVSYIDIKYRAVIREPTGQDWADLKFERESKDSAGDPVWILPSGRIEQFDAILAVMMSRLAAKCIEWGKAVHDYARDAARPAPTSTMNMLPPGFDQQADRMVIDLGIFKDPYLG